MSVRMTVVMLVLLVSCGVSHARTERWSNFAEDSDLKYYIDQKSVISLPDNVYIFWVKSVPKDRDYFKKEYNMNNVSYMFTSFEMDCAVSSYRVRGTIMYDKNRRELSKSLPEGEAAFEPVPPESMLELAQDEVCVKDESQSEISDGAGAAVAPVEPAQPETPGRPEAPPLPEEPLAPSAPAAPAPTEEPPALQ